MKNETILTSLPMHSVVTVQGVVNVHQREIGTLGIPSSYFRVDGCAYVLDPSHENTILLYTSVENEALRTLTSEVASKIDHHVYLIDKLEAIGVLPASMVIIDTDHLHEWEIRYFAQHLLNSDATEGKIFFFTQNTPYLASHPVNHIEGYFPLAEEYLEVICRASVKAKEVAKSLAGHIKDIVRGERKFFTGEEFLAAFRLLYSGLYSSSVAAVENAFIYYPVFLGGASPNFEQEMLDRELLKHLYNLDLGTCAANNDYNYDHLPAWRTFADIEKILWQDLSFKDS